MNLELCYGFFGIDEFSTLDEISKIYHKKVLQVHPDKNPNPEAHEEFIKLQEYYDFLLKNHCEESVQKVAVPVETVIVRTDLKTLYMEETLRILVLQRDLCLSCNGYLGKRKACVACDKRGIILTDRTNEYAYTKCTACKGKRFIYYDLCIECKGIGYTEKYVNEDFKLSRYMRNEMSIPIQDRYIAKLSIADCLGFKLQSSDILYESISISIEDSLNPYEFRFQHLDNSELKLCTSDIILDDDIFIVPGYGLSPDGNLLIRFRIHNRKFQISKKKKDVIYIEKKKNNGTRKRRTNSDCNQQ